MVALGSNHVTVDVDIVYARDTANLSALVASLRPQHPRLRGAPADLPFTFDLRTFQSALGMLCGHRIRWFFRPRCLNR